MNFGKIRFFIFGLVQKKFSQEVPYVVKFQKKMVFFLIHTFKKVLKKLNSRKIGKIRERIALEIFLPIFREFCIFNTFLKVYIKNCTFVLCLLHSEMSKTVFSKLLKKLNY